MTYLSRGTRGDNLANSYFLVSQRFNLNLHKTVQCLCQ